MLCSVDGSELASFPIEKKGLGRPEIRGVRREALLRVLSDALGDNSIVYGMDIVGVNSSQAGMDVGVWPTSCFRIEAQEI